jgi:hypothetical protein
MKVVATKAKARAGKRAAAQAEKQAATQAQARRAQVPQDLPPPDEPADLAKLLGDDIIFGRLGPGTRLIEDNLIARFGATRHFVRQALVELERMGTVVREEQRCGGALAHAARCGRNL